MPTPNKGEEKSAYISRCIKYCMDKEGIEQKAAVGKCYGMWDYYTKNNITERIDMFLEQGTTVADIDLTPASSRTKALPPTKPKKKKKNGDIMQKRRLQMVQSNL